MQGTRYPLEVQPVLPAALKPLKMLAGNLLYSWNRKVRGLFYRIDPDLWEICEHNPSIFLRRVAQTRLDALTQDRNFLRSLDEVLHEVETYLQETKPSNNKIKGLNAEKDIIAYFCMEYGLHESLRLYSGGLGVLAGDHCKAAADLGLPFIAIGLMYRQGYFEQTLSREGKQQAHFHPVNLCDLPITAVTDDAGKEIRIPLLLSDRQLQIRAWRADIGHTRLFLLDSDVAENTAADRTITYQLYGGDHRARIEQEIVLGICGVRLLHALNMPPTAWHINEGHAAFMLLERCREAVHAGLDFASALEQVAAATVFTTHTPVPAGHDLFPMELMARYFQPYAQELGITLKELMALGSSPQNGHEFNMTALALRGSRYHNGVSRIHGRVASKMEAYIWPQIDPPDNPLGFVSNGVHVPTFLAREWVNLFDARYPDWRNHLHDPVYWQNNIAAIPDHRFWSLRQSLKSEMLQGVREILCQQYCRNQFARGRIEMMKSALAPDNTRTLIIGFARRFATYKRALLLFQDRERLARLLDRPKQPVIILVAGKAHPQDGPGQLLIQHINEFAASPEFMGKIFFIEDYDLALARKLVTGTDVWLNTPQYPLEASGTSGQKAAINGGLNVSVLDGWWAEAYNGHNGWAIQPHDEDMEATIRDKLEAQELLDILEQQVIPCYYDRGPSGYSECWVEKSKTAVTSVLPRFSAHRMVMDYLQRYYLPAMSAGKRLAENGGEHAQRLAAWKKHIHAHWSGVSLRWLEPPPAEIRTGETLELRIAMHLNGLTTEDLRVECLLKSPVGAAKQQNQYSVHTFEAQHTGHEINEAFFTLAFSPPENGLLHFHVHAYPWHEYLNHPFEMGLRIWL